MIITRLEWYANLFPHIDHALWRRNRCEGGGYEALHACCFCCSCERLLVLQTLRINCRDDDVDAM